MRKFLFCLALLRVDLVSAQGHTSSQEDSLATLAVVLFLIALLFAIGLIVYENWEAILFWCLNAALISLFIGSLAVLGYGLYKVAAGPSDVVVPKWLLLVLAILVAAWLRVLYQRAIAAERERDRLRFELTVVLQGRYKSPVG